MAPCAFPNTAGDLELVADLRAQQLVASVTVTAPQDKGAIGRVSWLVNQLKDANPALLLEAYLKNAKTGPTATLAQVLDDRQALVGDDKREAFKFRVVWRRDMGMPRKSGGKNPGFVDTVLGLIDSFYGQVVQNITPWTPPAPKTRCEYCFSAASTPHVVPSGDAWRTCTRCADRHPSRPGGSEIPLR